MDELLIRFWVLASASSLLATPPTVTGLAADAMLVAAVDRDVVNIFTNIFLSVFATWAAITPFGYGGAHVEGLVAKRFQRLGQTAEAPVASSTGSACPSVQA